MDDSRIFDMIKQETEAGARPDFNALLSRLEAGEGEELPAVDMQLEAQRTPVFYISRVLATAAAIAIVFLGASFLFIATRGAGAAAPESAEGSMYEDSFAYENDSSGDETNEMYVVSNEASGDEFQPSSDGDNTEIAMFGNSKETLTVGSVPSFSDFRITYADMQTHYLEALEMSIDLPRSASVTSRNVAPSFPLLSELGITAEELSQRMEDKNIYLEAVLSDSDTKLSEIVVNMTRDKSSKELYNLSWADEYQLGLIKAQYEDYKSSQGVAVGASFYDVTTVDIGQALFFRANGTVAGEDTQANHLQYMTVVNGMKIEITLIEYVDVSDIPEDERISTVSEDNAALLDELIYSVTFDHIRSKLGFELGSWAIVLISVSAISAIVLLLYFALKKRKALLSSTEDIEAENNDE